MFFLCFALIVIGVIFHSFDFEFTGAQLLPWVFYASAIAVFLYLVYGKRVTSNKRLIDKQYLYNLLFLSTRDGNLTFDEFIYIQSLLKIRGMGELT